MKRVLLSFAAALGLSASPVIGADSDINDLKKAMLEQQEQINSLKEALKKQESVHNEAVQHYIKNEVRSTLRRQGGSGSLLTLGGSHIENLTIKGDFRVRAERRERPNNATATSKSSDRFRVRYRLGFVWKTSEGWDIGAGFATGTDNGDGRSTNDTYNENAAFETNRLNLDYAYARHTWKGEGNKRVLTIGQSKRLFKGSKVLWDGDIRPVGITYQYFTTNKEDGNFFATTGIMNVRNIAATTVGNSGSNDTFLYMAQAGIECEMLTAAIGYFHYTDTANQFIVLDRMQGGTANRDQEYHIINGLVEFRTGPVTLFGEFNYNMSADNGASHIGGVTGDEDFAYILGVSGKPSKQIKLAYYYRHVEANSQPAVLVDSDFAGGSTNFKGHTFHVRYFATKHMELSFKALLGETIEDNPNQQDKDNTFLLDLIYKF